MKASHIDNMNTHIPTHAGGPTCQAEGTSMESRVLQTSSRLGLISSSPLRAEHTDSRQERATLSRRLNRSSSWRRTTTRADQAREDEAREVEAKEDEVRAGEAREGGFTPTEATHRGTHTKSVFHFDCHVCLSVAYVYKFLF